MTKEFDNTVYNDERLVSKFDKMQAVQSVEEQDLVYRLRKRAEIRRQIKDRKSVQEGKADRISDLLEEAATYIERMRLEVEGCWQDAAGEDL
jgi:hypothetical protein